MLWSCSWSWSSLRYSEESSASEFDSGADDAVDGEDGGDCDISCGSSGRGERGGLLFAGRMKDSGSGERDGIGE